MQGSNPSFACWFSSISSPKGQVKVSVLSSMEVLLCIQKERSSFGNQDCQRSRTQIARTEAKLHYRIIRSNNERSHYHIIPLAPRSMYFACERAPYFISYMLVQGIFCTLENITQSWNFTHQCYNQVFNWPFYCYVRSSSLEWWICMYKINGLSIHTHISMYKANEFHGFKPF